MLFHGAGIYSVLMSYCPVSFFSLKKQKDMSRTSCRTFQDVFRGPLMPADIIDLFHEQGFEPKKKTAGEWSSTCPACGGTKRCSIWPARGEGRGYYWCRECGAKGDGIQFLRDYAKMSYADACARIGVASAAWAVKTPSLPQRAEKNRFESVENTGPKDVDVAAWRTCAGNFVRWAETCLQRSQEHLAWLAARGIDAAAARRYRLGFNPGERGKNCIIRPRSTWGLPDVLKDDGKPKRLWLPRGIVIPQIVNDEVRRLRIRRLDSDRAEFNPDHKYHVVEGSEMQPLWLESTTPLRDGQGAVVVVETELDALMLNAQAGDLVHCLALGTCNVRNLPAQLYKRLTDSLVILVALDADDAGAEGWPRWQETFPTAKRWPVPAGKDPGDAFAKGEDMRLWLLSGLPEGLRLTLDRATPAVVEPEIPEETFVDEGEDILDSAAAYPADPNRPTDAILEFWDMWKRYPIKYIRERNAQGKVCGFSFVYPYPWSHANPGVVHRFFRFRDDHPEIMVWLSRNKHDIVTARNFMDVEKYNDTEEF